MKKLLLLLALALCMQAAYSQKLNIEKLTINGEQLSSIESKYISFYHYDKKHGCVVSLYYDKALTGSIDSGHRLISDENGDYFIFNTIISVLNMFSELGYEYVDTYVYSGKTFFLLKKSK